jgi:E3 ubiquitin-protein ligase EDD1
LQDDLGRSPAKSVIVRVGPTRDTPDVLVVPTEVSKSDAEAATAHVTVETSPSSQALEVLHRPHQSLSQSVSHDLLLGRWRLALDLFGRVFMEDVGLEPGSVVSELGGFPVKEAKFRREMEKVRTAQQRDLVLNKMERNRGNLIMMTFKEFNTQFNNYNRRSNGAQPPLAVNRVKVTFRDEPGEGSGVARSYYTALAEALLSNDKLPNLESAQVCILFSYSSLQDIIFIFYLSFTIFFNIKQMLRRHFQESVVQNIRSHFSPKNFESKIDFSSLHNDIVKVDL